jgi:uncharacterized membrane protein
MPSDTDPRDEPDPADLWRWVRRASRPWVGWVFIGLGALLILLGYLGVSREAIVAKQIPYLVSGGIGGVFLAVLGAYFLGTQEIRSDSGRLDRVERMVEELHAALLRRPDAPVREETTGEAASNGSGAPARRVVYVDGGELYHRASCRLVAGKDLHEASPATARKHGLRACPACTPARASAAS